MDGGGDGEDTAGGGAPERDGLRHGPAAAPRPHGRRRTLPGFRRRQQLRVRRIPLLLPGDHRPRLDARGGASRLPGGSRHRGRPPLGACSSDRPAVHCGAGAHRSPLRLLPSPLRDREPRAGDGQPARRCTSPLSPSRRARGRYGLPTARSISGTTPRAPGSGDDPEDPAGRDHPDPLRVVYGDNFQPAGALSEPFTGAAPPLPSRRPLAYPLPESSGERISEDTFRTARR